MKALWIHSYFDNVMTKFMVNNRPDAWKTDVNLLNRRREKRKPSQSPIGKWGWLCENSMLPKNKQNHRLEGLTLELN